MDWPTWRPTYAQILAEFGYARADDERARDALDALLDGKLQADLGEVRAALRGREAWIVGAAATPEAVGAIPDDAPTLVADGAAHVAIPLRRPLAVVTDLDGDVLVQAAASAMGVPLFVHAHGDNEDALRLHVPHLVGPLVGTTQAQPKGRVRNFGGFTDGDRAACIAVELGARALALVGFDYDAPVPKLGTDPPVKMRKLAWARRIVEGLGVPVRHVA